MPLLLIFAGLAGIVFCGFWAVSIRNKGRKKIELREVANRAATERQDRDRLRAESRKKEMAKSKADAARAVESLLRK